MTRILLTAMFLTLFAHTASAEAVFFCNGTNFVEIKNNELSKYKTQNFKFSVNEKFVKFGSGGYFADTIMPTSYWLSEDFWTAANTISITKMHKGQFMYAASKYEDDGVAGLLITATCDKF